MANGKRRPQLEGMMGANITPLADVTTTLIVVFLVTMPSILWSGIQVDAAVPEGGQQVVAPTKPSDEEKLLMVEVTTKGIRVNRERVALSELESTLTDRLAVRDDKTVVVVPSQDVPLGDVVTVLDMAKASGAGSLALLKYTDGEAGR